MGYRSLLECVVDLERHGRLRRVDAEVDPHLELAEIQRRVQACGGPAILFTRVKGTTFPVVSGLFGTIDRARFLFRDTLSAVRRLIALKIDPADAIKRPWRYVGLIRHAFRALPAVRSRASVLAETTTIRQLPQIVCWPKDGGSFVTLPMVYTEDPDHPGWQRSNLGMYRVQLSGNDYEPDREVGLHYQIHRGIGVHHSHAVRRGEKLRAAVAVGGPPSLAISAVMPLPEGMPEVTFAGVLGGRRTVITRGPEQIRMPGEADFCIIGTIDPDRTKPEGPFGDHLGYYSWTHPFPFLKVEQVYHRRGAIWPFTVVGRPPQEDTTFGELIHEITGPVIPSVLPGVEAVHAVDAAGVHPLLLAVGSERYAPYEPLQRPMELLTQANAILGQGQLSLAKFLLIVNSADFGGRDIHDIPGFFTHLLERIDLTNDLHFQTRTTIDTLDYSAGMGLNAGSKLVMAAVGPPRRRLADSVPEGLVTPSAFTDVRVVRPGILAVTGPRHRGLGADQDRESAMAELLSCWDPQADQLSAFPLIVLVDDAEFTARRWDNFLWVVFTRADPANDVHGLRAVTSRKHWGCRGSLVIDARLKPHHPDPLECPSEIRLRVDRLAAPGGPLHGIIRD